MSKQLELRVIVTAFLFLCVAVSARGVSDPSVGLLLRWTITTEELGKVGTGEFLIYRDGLVLERTLPSESSTIVTYRRVKKAAAARKAAEDDGEALPVSQLVARVVREKSEGERFGPSSLAKELNQRFAKTLRRRLDGRSVSIALRRLAAEGRIRIVEKGRAFHEAVYTRR
jgi:hypothetical protein